MENCEKNLKLAIKKPELMQGAEATERKELCDMNT